MPFVRTDSSPFRVPTPSRADLIAAELDQRRIGDGKHSWVLHVFGVHGDERDLWIQVSDRPDGEDGFVLHLSPWATAAHAIAALAAVQRQAPVASAHARAHRRSDPRRNELPHGGAPFG
jgi:hypothetical protein